MCELTVVGSVKPHKLSRNPQIFAAAALSFALAEEQLVKLRAAVLQQAEADAVALERLRLAIGWVSPRIVISLPACSELTITLASATLPMLRQAPPPPACASQSSSRA